MNQRRVPIVAFAGTVLIAAALAMAVTFGSAQSLNQRVSFQILTGSTGGTYFPVGQLIAGLLSHPPGVDRCESQPVCGPAGVIISARTSDGAVANVLAVNAGRAESGLAQADVVAQAVAGEGVFAKHGKLSDLRVIADLFPEDVHLLVARGAKIGGVADLKGKRVSLGADGSGTSVTARAILAAYGLRDWRLKLSHDSPEADVQKMAQGNLDAFFFVGGRPVSLVEDLIRKGIARLVPIDGKGRAKLLKMQPTMSADAIPAGTYPRIGSVDTVSVHALWVVNAHQPDRLVYGLTRALFAPGNRAALGGAPPANAIRLDNALVSLSAPLHPGAAQFYRDVGRLTKAAR